MRTGTVALLAITGLVISPMGIAAEDLFDLRLDELEKIIVTAQKREEDVADVPIAIDVSPGPALRELRVFTSDDLIGIYPNLSLKAANSINSGFSIRGVGTANFHITAQQAVGTYADEVSLASPYVSEFALFDLARIEVLRGPQNTLFGRNTTGGAVNIISNKPSLTQGTNGYLRAELGNAGTRNGEFAVGWQLGERTAARIALSSTRADGVFRDIDSRRELGATDRRAGRLQLLWAPSSQTEVLLNVHAAYSRSDRSPSKAIGAWEPGSPNIGSVGARGPADCGILFSADPERFERANNCVSAINANVFNPSTPDDWHDVHDIASNVADVDFEGAILKIIHEFEQFTLTSITSIDEIEVQTVTNTSSSGRIQFFPGQEGEFEIFSQELRFTSPDTNSIRWIGGLHFSNERDLLATIIRNGSDDTPAFTLVPSVAVQQEVDIFSAYGQVEFDLNREFSLSVGLRYTNDEKSGKSTSRVIAGTTTGLPGGTVAPADFVYDLNFLEALTGPGTGACPPTVGGVPCVLAIPVSQTLEEWGGKVSLNWSYNANALAYASYARGFKSGAFDTRALAAFAGNADKPVGPEFLDAFEIGWKNSFYDGAMNVTAAVFHYIWKDLQTFATDPLGAPAFLNIPETHLTGGELTTRWSLDTGWYIQAGIGYTDSEIVDSGGLSSAKQGAPVDETPELTYTGLIRKTHRFDAGTLRLQTNFKYADEANSGSDDNPLTRKASTFFLNARLSFQFGTNQQYEVALWGENLTSEKTCIVVGENGALTNAVTCLLNPGMAFYGASFELRF